MKITIPKQENSSITEEIVIELGNYTILAGENNSGKTNLIKAIMEHSDLNGYKKIHIPAEETDPEDKETKLSAKTDSFYKLVETILEPIFKTEMFENLIKDFNSSKEKSKFVGDVNVILKNLGVEKKEFDVKISQDDLKKDIVIKVTKAIVKDLYDSDIDDVELKNIGTGTRRMIVTALIQYYAYSKIKADEKTIFVFEEPEVYLHPKWKKGLYESLCEISKTNLVLITTHDPYFIELGKNQKIYQVYRDSGKKDATAIRPMGNSVLLSFKSDSEVNYSVYDLPTIEFHNELYGRIQELQQKYTIDQAEIYFVSKGITKSKKWIAIVGGQAQQPEDVTLMTFVRHLIHHPENRNNGGYTPQELKSSIDELIKLIKTP